MILKFFLLLISIFGTKDEIPLGELVGNWDRVCIENDALGFQVSHCKFFGDKKMYINEWNYIEMTFKNGERRFYDFKLDGDKIKIFYKYRENIESVISVNGDTLKIESNKVYNEMMNRKYDADINRIYFIRSD